MKKTLLATAVAGALGASAGIAQAATIYNQDGTQLDLYGNIQLAYRSIDNENGDAEDDLFDNGSTVGFSGQHVINPGLTGYFKAEFEHDADEEKTGAGLDTGDQAYLGLKGNFGDARVGSWDPLIDDWIQDPITNNEYFDVTDSTSDLGGLYGGSTVDAVDTDREGDKIQYMSPSFGGLQFAVGSQYKGDAEEEFNSDNGTANVSSNGSNASFFGGLKYTAGAFSIAAVYDDLDNYDLRDETTGDEYSAKAYGVNAQYTMDALRVSAKVENTDVDYAGENGDIMRYALGARYGYGFGDIYGAYQRVDADEEVATVVDSGGDDSFNEFSLGATYNLSPAMYTFVEYAQYDRTNDEGDGVAVGAVYSF
ncbi:porin [Chromohalobacter israelensis]|uniref:Porin, Gram-negative type n=1 Tax=Chromohalobacter israelensis (strain ATCC BAA-138 / DSM 3043 / CIP 106854 / NCIMB 13768 / 1H11) TaxID=290398 RepID=Q1QUE2_CHRI1|nr:porin [Chromohalobacter salexigens]ABE59916.1 porin, Gram-negative type [Chromohalobacter salexigens DSM 3043]